MSGHPRPVVAVVGPTATGKSDLGVDLALHLGGEVINADASQLYRGMDIGTAKLTRDQRRGIAHHQLDVLEVTDEASVADYQERARADMAAIRDRGRVPIVVGGSGLYVRAALDRLEIPPRDPHVRARWEARLEQLGAEALHRELADCDPEAADRIIPANARRVVRALEVIELTGRPFSATMPTREFIQPTVMFGLRGPRDELDTRIENRVGAMWQAGLLDEVRALEQQGLRHGVTASRAIGYAQALAELDGVLTTEQAQEQTTAGTRRLVRRQESWFRPDPRIHWLPAGHADLLGQALRVIEENSATMET
ncbi:tRNA (adenosine(37)-N6)-dimethylallyltransferase MiaA [Demetria terragena]|uniref:tRNA (adenosine(37)-N6)-dimethylallyltransferase MiaA n=1 Tax=Demetria terragena TaxID=63959 RepID=UPI00058CEA66|nr:tRNA (adenosine(37)-N6)-dimethylallyltransferase MiaA [Demetria terragena]